jgi:hypothetical protein
LFRVALTGEYSSAFATDPERGNRASGSEKGDVDAIEGMSP